MGEDKLLVSKKAIVKTVESADKHLGKTYDNLTNKPSKAIGEGLTDLIQLIFSLFKLGNGMMQAKISSSVEKFKKEIEEKSNSIPEDKLTEPDVQVITTAIENSKYCVTEDELREMFVNLIGSACNSDTKDDVHPAFSAIIKEMSPEDAKVLKGIKQLTKKSKFNEFDIFDQIAAEYSLQYSFAQLMMSVDNLVRLGLLCKIYKTNNHILNKIAGISLPENEKISQQIFDKFLDEHPNLPKALIEGLKYVAETSYSFTNMGRKFIKVCC